MLYLQFFPIRVKIVTFIINHHKKNNLKFKIANFNLTKKFLETLEISFLIY